MAESMRIHDEADGHKATVRLRVRMSHKMGTGRRQDSAVETKPVRARRASGAGAATAAAAAAIATALRCGPRPCCGR